MYCARIPNSPKKIDIYISRESRILPDEEYIYIFAQPTSIFIFLKKVLFTTLAIFYASLHVYIYYSTNQLFET